MPYIDEEDPSWTKFQERVAEALQPFAADLGARVCAHGDWAKCDAGEDEMGCTFDETQPKPGSMPVLINFVLVSEIKDMGNAGDQDTAVVAAPQQRNTVTKGLLHVALYE